MAYLDYVHSRRTLYLPPLLSPSCPPVRYWVWRYYPEKLQFYKRTCVHFVYLVHDYVFKIVSNLFTVEYTTSNFSYDNFRGVGGGGINTGNASSSNAPLS